MTTTLYHKGLIVLDIKSNLKKLFASVTNYQISKDTGIGQTTLGRYTSGGSKIGNMKLDHAITLNKYYLNNKEEIKMNQLKMMEGWLADAVNVLGGIEDLAKQYDADNYGNAEQFVVDMLEQDGRVRDFDYYTDHEDEEAAANDDGYIWIDEIDKWVNLDG